MKSDKLELIKVVLLLIVPLVAYQNCSDIRVKGRDRTTQSLPDITIPGSPPGTDTDNPGGNDETDPTPGPTPGNFDNSNIAVITLPSNNGTNSAHEASSQQIYNSLGKPPYSGGLIWTGKYFVASSGCTGTNPARRGLWVYSKEGKLLGVGDACKDMSTGSAAMLMQWGFSEQEAINEENCLRHGMCGDGGWFCNGNDQGLEVVDTNHVAFTCHGGHSRGAIVYNIRQGTNPDVAAVTRESNYSNHFFSSIISLGTSGYLVHGEPKYNNPLDPNSVAGVQKLYKLNSDMSVARVFTGNGKPVCGNKKWILTWHGWSNGKGIYKFQKYNDSGLSSEVTPPFSGQIALNGCRVINDEMLVFVRDQSVLSAQGGILYIFKVTDGAEPELIRQIVVPSYDKSFGGVAKSGDVIVVGPWVWFGTQGPIKVQMPESAQDGDPISRMIDSVAVTEDGYVMLINQERIHLVKINPPN